MIGWLKKFTKNKPEQSAEDVSLPGRPNVVEAEIVEPKQEPVEFPTRIPAEKIAQRAFEIWIANGRPEGMDLQNWLRAEAELRADLIANVRESLPRHSR